MAEETIATTQTRDDIPEVDFSSREYFDYVYGVYEDVRDYKHAEVARRAAQQIQRILTLVSDLRRSDPDLYRDWQRLMIKFQFVAFPLLTEEVAAYLLSDHLFTGLSIRHYSLKRMFDALMVRIDYDPEIFNFVKETVESMEQSKLRLGQEKIVTKQGELEPTVANWIKAYQFDNIDKKKRGSFERITFITKNENVQRLSEAEKTLLKKVLSFYDWLHYFEEYDDFDDEPPAPPEMKRLQEYAAEHAEELVAEILRQEGETVDQTEDSEKEPESEERTETSPPSSESRLPEKQKNDLSKSPAPSPSSDSSERDRVESRPPASSTPEPNKRPDVAATSGNNLDQRVALQMSGSKLGSPGSKTAPPAKPAEKSRQPVPPAPQRDQTDSARAKPDARPKPSQDELKKQLDELSDLQDSSDRDQTNSDSLAELRRLREKYEQKSTLPKRQTLTSPDQQGKTKEPERLDDKKGSTIDADSGEGQREVGQKPTPPTMKTASQDSPGSSGNFKAALDKIKKTNELETAKDESEKKDEAKVEEAAPVTREQKTSGAGPTQAKLEEQLKEVVPDQFRPKASSQNSAGDGGDEEEYEPFSVNEALINANRQEEEEEPEQNDNLNFKEILDEDSDSKG